MKKNQDKKSILVVDDDGMVLAMMGVILREYGYNVNLLEDANAVLANIEKNPPDLILLDLIMPEKDGSEVLKEIKGMKRWEKIPILLVSASHKVKDVAREYGANGYVEKPFDIEKLYEAIETNLTV